MNFETAIHYVNVAAWYLHGASVLAWAVIAFGCGLFAGRILPNRHVKLLRAELVTQEARHARNLARLTALIRAVTDDVTRLHDALMKRQTPPGEPTLVHPEPSGAPAAGPERHEPPREGDEGV